MIIEIWNDEEGQYNELEFCCIECEEAEYFLYFDEDDELIAIEDEITGELWSEDDIFDALEEETIVLTYRSPLPSPGQWISG